MTVSAPKRHGRRQGVTTTLRLGQKLERIDVTTYSENEIRRDLWGFIPKR